MSIRFKSPLPRERARRRRGEVQEHSPLSDGHGCREPARSRGTGAEQRPVNLLY
jgi:hypothetical protein